MEAIDGIIYINLDHCTERKKEIEKEFSRLNIPPKKIHRLSGVYDQLNGTRGCLLSHMMALQLAIKKKWQSVLICEDDIFFTCDGKVLEQKLNEFISFANGMWDVFLLTGSFIEKEKTNHQNILKINRSWNAGAYLVNGNYLEKLFACFTFGYEIAKNHLFYMQSERLRCSTDQLWQVLQKEDLWYGAFPRLTLQRLGDSHINISSKPFDHFGSIIFIDQGNSQNRFSILDNISVDVNKVATLKTPQAAIEKAISLNTTSALIIYDHITLEKSQKRLDEEIRHLKAWLGEDWDLYLLDHFEGALDDCEHLYYQKIKKLDAASLFAIKDRFYPTLLNHLKNGKTISSFRVEPHHKIYCAKPDKTTVTM
ncbi:MAG: glycosyltransferase family 25 protein [Chlamydiia bacterium]|nr:glycosyltransferase family 25 protein [Chlamydiia bacterium]